MNRILPASIILIAALLPLYGWARPHVRPSKPRPAPDIQPGNCGDPASPGALSYPPQALIKAQAGWVVVAFDLKPDGAPANAVVIDASPKGLFEQSALAALNGSRFSASDATREQCQKLYVYSIGQWDR